MKNAKSIKAVLFVGVGLLLGSALARADSFTFTLASDYQSGVSGDVLEFDATVNNNTENTAYFNSDSASVTAPLVLDDTAFWTTFAFDPITANYDLPPGGSYTGELFTVTILPDTPAGLYAGGFTILGGGPTDSDPLGSADFNVQVTPEPPSWELLAMALAALLALMGWNSSRRQTTA